MATMVDVARIAGVSISTVSHVLNGTRNVEKDTRKRVLKAIEATGYRQDSLARAMRRSRTDSIGLVVSEAGEPAFAEMVHGVEHAAAERGLTLLLANSAEDAEREAKAIRTLLERRIDGLVLARAADSRPSLLAELQAEKTPVVLLDRLFPEVGLDQVGADNRESMRRLTQQLASQGHREIAIVAGDVRVPALSERLDGFLDGIRDGALSAESQVVLRGVRDEELLATLTTLLREDRVTAIVSCSTPLAVVALRAISDAARTTPGDVAFATFDGFSNSDLFRPGITTVRQPAFEMGVAAVGLLADRMAAPGIGPRTLRLHQSLELRESTEGYRRQASD